MVVEKKQREAVIYHQLYRLSTWSERVAIAIAVVLAFLSGFIMAWVIAQFGEFNSMMVDRSVMIGTSTPTIILKLFGGGRILTNASAEENRAALLEDCAAHGIGLTLQFIIGTALAGLAASIMNATAIRQLMRWRLKFLKSVIRQDMTWFDMEKSLNIASTMNDDMQKIKEGISEKVAMFVFLIATGVISVGVAFPYGWKLTLACCTILPFSIGSAVWVSNKIKEGISEKVAMFVFLIATGVISVGVAFPYGWKLTLACCTILPFSIGSAVWVSNYQMKSGTKEQESYSIAGRVVEETIAGIRTVVAFGAEKKQIDRYAKCLEPAETGGRKRGYITGVGNGITWFLTYFLAAITFLYGVRLIMWDAVLPYDERTYFSGNMMTILFSVFMASQNISMCTTHTESFSAACGAASSVFRLCETVPPIDSLDQRGGKPKALVGEVRLDNVHFNYPARKEVKVLKGLSLHIKQGETVALVGSSGCGKSTILQLVQRMYDPSSGSVCVGNTNVKNYNLSWLRSRIGVVGQEPVLFSGTIRENIALGKPGATMDEIKRAAKLAYAHEFISSLTNGYETVIAERGTQLSGGQKQRIAIARSMIRDPPLLLLDEATSALDPQSERKVQAALDKACVGRTTLIVSHRLSTIVNASRIVCMDQGVIIEEGTHSELLKKRGFYWKLVNTGGESIPVETVPEAEGETEEEQENIAYHQPRRLSSANVVRRNSSVRRDMKPRASVFSLASSTGTVPTGFLLDTPKGEEEPEPNPASGWELLRLNGPEWPLITIGTIAAVIQGATYPIFGILFSGVFSVLGDLPDENMLATSDLYSCMFLVVAAAAGVSMFLQGALFTSAGLKLTTRLRIQAFSAYLNNEISFFDEERHSVGVLCARLSGDAAAVQAGTGSRVGLMLQSMAAIVIGTVIAFCYSWKMALVGIAFMPVVAGIVWFESHLAGTSAEKETAAMEKATKVATEAILAIKTVQSMAIEPIVMEKYRKALEEATNATSVALRWRGLVYGLGQFLPIASYNVTFLYGAVLVAQDGMPYNLAILVAQNMIVGAWALAQALVYGPNFRNAAISAARILDVIRRKPQIKTEEGVKDDPNWTATGAFDMKKIHFTYPTRPNQRVLRGFDLKVDKGKMVALVGHSGCGKSTCLQLLQRFYDVDSGTIELDSKNIRTELSLSGLRKQLGVVQQEPTLFERTLAENIAFGDNTREVPMHEIVEAAKAANIHTFIVGLPQGYETTLGSGGAQMSGGQKQRVCIARALLRSPRLLLLDEATSALDAQSQKVVADALEHAAKGRTCITIAHRLSTIQNADLICVVDKGKIVERGNHEELMALDGHYRKMHRLQATEMS